jgi:hypothetical protein
MNYLQQGDVLLKRHSGPMPGNTSKGPLLHKGQQHHHSLRGGAFRIIEGDGGKFLDVEEATELTHEEHKTIPVPAGQYKVEFVQEYDHWLEESRQVVD